MGDYPKTVSEVCDAAADFIETHGWHQGDFVANGFVSEWQPGEAVCAVGGIRGVTGGLNSRVHPSLDVACNRAIYALGRYVGETNVPAWNDTPGRTRTEVVQALRDTATKHRPDAMSTGSDT